MASANLPRAIRELPTTAAKIRALAAAGRSRVEIASALDIRYQHVRNVLVREEAKAKETHDADPATGKVQVGSDGDVLIPAAALQSLALKPGDPLFVRLDAGEIQLLTREAVARRVRSLVRQFVPEGVSLVDELLEDRRREVESENA